MLPAVSCAFILTVWSHCTCNIISSVNGHAFYYYVKQLEIMTIIMTVRILVYFSLRSLSA